MLGRLHHPYLRLMFKFLIAAATTDSSSNSTDFMEILVSLETSNVVNVMTLFVTFKEYHL